MPVNHDPKTIKHQRFNLAGAASVIVFLLSAATSLISAQSGSPLITNEDTAVSAERDAERSGRLFTTETSLNAFKIPSLWGVPEAAGLEARTPKEKTKMKPVICIALLTLCSAAANNTPKAWSDWVSEGKVLTRAGNFAAAAQAFRRALPLAEAANAGERKLVAIYGALASTEAEAGQYSESEHDSRRALALAKKTEGLQSLGYALLVASMAVLPTQIGNREPVIEQLREAITVNRGTGSVRALAIIRICLARILIEAKRYGEAESVLLDAQSGAATLKASDPGRFADLLNCLGVLRFAQGRYVESVDLCLESIRVFESAMGNEQPSLIAVSNNLALSYLKLGRLNDAEPTLKHAIAVCSKTLGDDHPTCGTLLGGYSVVLRKLHRNGEAKAVAAKSREIDRASRTRNGVGATISFTGLRIRSNNVP